MLGLADGSLEEAKLLLEANKLRGTVSRAYYSMFDATKALLYTKGIEAKTHKGTIALLGQHFIKTKKLDPWFSKVISEAFDLRQASDYEIEVQFDKETADKTVRDAEKFVEDIKKFISANKENDQ